MRDERDSGVMCESRFITIVIECVLWFVIEAKKDLGETEARWTDEGSLRRASGQRDGN